MDITHFYLSLAKSPQDSLSLKAHTILSTYPSRDVRMAWASRTDIPADLRLARVKAEEDRKIRESLSQVDDPEVTGFLFSSGLYAEALRSGGMSSFPGDRLAEEIEKLVSGMSSAKAKRFFDSELMPTMFANYDAPFRYSKRLYDVMLRLVKPGDMFPLVTEDSAVGNIDLLLERIMSFGVNQNAFSCLWWIVNRVDFEELPAAAGAKLQKMISFLSKQPVPPDDKVSVEAFLWWSGQVPRPATNHKVAYIEASRQKRLAARALKKIESLIALGEQVSAEEMSSLLQASGSTTDLTLEQVKEWLGRQPDTSVDADLLGKWCNGFKPRISYHSELVKEMLRCASDKKTLYSHEPNVFAKWIFVRGTPFEEFLDFPAQEVASHASAADVFKYIDAIGPGALDVFNSLIATFEGSFGELLVAAKEFASH